MTDSSDIDKLIEDMNSNQLNQNENATVNSILQELNGDNTQQSKPQITDEEKELLRQQQIAQQQIEQQRIMQAQAQQMAQVQQVQQIQQAQIQQKGNESMVDKVKKILTEYREVLYVLVLSIIFNLEPVSENLVMKNVSFMYNMETGKGTVLSIVFKSLIISVIFLLLKVFLK